MEFVKGMAFQLKSNAEAYSFPNFMKEIFSTAKPAWW